MVLRSAAPVRSELQRAQHGERGRAGDLPGGEGDVLVLRGGQEPQDEGDGRQEQGDGDTDLFPKMQFANQLAREALSCR